MKKIINKTLKILEIIIIQGEVVKWMDEANNRWFYLGLNKNLYAINYKNN